MNKYTRQVITLGVAVSLAFLATSCRSGKAPEPLAPATQVEASPTTATETPTQAAEETATATVTPTPLPPTPTAQPTETPLPPTPTSLPPLSESGGGIIAFVSERSGRPGVYIMNADGSDPRLVSDSFDTHPDWSPDGTKIAYSTRRSDTVAIYLTDLTSNTSRQLTDTDRSPSAPDWSPDGERFAFIYNPAHPGINYELYLMDNGGKGFVRLTESAGYQTYSGPDWSPDGSLIAVSADLAGNFDIYIVNTDGEDLLQLTSHEADDRSPAWSPDGNQIAFESYRDGNWEIFVMNVDGSNVRNISNSPSRELWPSWSPDGSRIAFQSDRDRNWEIYVMNADGSNVVRLTENEVKDSEPAWKP